MALDATVAGASANSYLTVGEADALAAADLGPEASGWLNQQDTAVKEAALQRATRDIDAYLRSGWSQYSSTQALIFPRLIDQGAAGPFLPTTLQRATYEQATYVLANAAVLDRSASRRARDLASASEPNTAYTQSVEGDGGNISPAALAYLEGYRTAGTKRGLRSVRMASGYLP